MPFLTFKDYQIHYESIRVDHAPEDIVIVFLHEALGSIPQWRTFPKELCEKMKINGVVYERCGHGNSSPLQNERTEKYLHDYAYQELHEFINTLFSSDKKIILVGHSDGGTIALLYASKYPKQIKSVITMAAHVINEQETINGIFPAIKAFEEGKLEKLNNFHGNKTKALFYAWANTWKSESFLNWDISNDIKNIEADCLILQGDKDQYGTENQLRIIKESISTFCVTKIINQCGHHPHLEQKELVIDLISNFINR